MATYTSNYGWTKPSGSDNVDISVLNDNLDGQDSVIHDAFLNMAVPFSELSTYAVGDIVLYGTTTYKCHTAVVTPGSWTGSTNWQVYKLSEGGSGGGGTSNYNDLTNKPSINSVELSGNKTTSDLGINADNVMMSDGVTSVEDAVDGLTSGLTSVSHTGNLTGGSSITIAGHDNGNVRLIVVKRAVASVFAIVASEYWSDAIISVFGTLPANITITKSTASSDITITNNTSNAIAYLVLN